MQFYLGAVIFIRCCSFWMCVIKAFRFVLLSLLHVCFIDAMFPILNIIWAHEAFSIIFIQCRLINRADILIKMHFLKFDFTPHKANKPLQGMGRRRRRTGWKGYMMQIYFTKYYLFHIWMMVFQQNNTVKFETCLWFSEHR